MDGATIRLDAQCALTGHWTGQLDAPGAILNEEAAEVNPLKLTLALVRRGQKKVMRVFIHTHVNAYRRMGNDSVLSTTTLTNALATANVVVTTGNGGTQAGNITVASPVAWSSGGRLTLSAYNNVVVNASISNAGGANVILRADNTGTGTGTVLFRDGGNVSTSGQMSIF